jgi:hypothetical protein
MLKNTTKKTKIHDPAIMRAMGYNEKTCSYAKQLEAIPKSNTYDQEPVGPSDVTSMPQSTRPGNTHQTALLQPTESGDRGEPQLEDARQFLLMILERRFGPLPVMVQNMVAKASLGILEDWTLKAQNAAALIDVF